MKYHYLEHLEKKLKGNNVLASKEARRLARILKKEFFARRVILFGSLVSYGNFHFKSDIDLAVEGIPDDKFFKAVGKIVRTSRFPVDIKPVEDMPENFRKEVELQGILL